jgi:hypothetical protein
MDEVCISTMKCSSSRSHSRVIAYFSDFMPHAMVGGHQYSFERAFFIGFFVFDNLFDVLTAI